MTRHSASRGIMYSAPPENDAADADGEGAEAVAEEPADPAVATEAAAETPPAAADDD